MIIDTEWEEFGNTGQLDHIQTNIDRAIDFDSVHKGKQTQDKYIAGKLQQQAIPFAAGTITILYVARSYCSEFTFLNFFRTAYW